MGAQGTASHGQKSMQENRKARPSKRKVKSSRQFSSRSLKSENKLKDQEGQTKILKNIKIERRASLFKTALIVLLFFIVSYFLISTVYFP